MVVIQNGIDVDRFHPDSVSRNGMRQAWGISDRDQLIGLVGRLDPMKGHDTFIKAATLLSRGRDNIRYVCVGDGPEVFKQKLVALSKEVGLGHRLIWVSAGDDVGATYNALDLVTSCSYGEGFSNVIGEAMACGKPCVVTDVGDSAVIVGDAGRVVPPKDSNALAAGWASILDLNQERRNALSAAARQRIVEHYSLANIVAQYEALYMDLAGGGRGSIP